LWLEEEKEKEGNKNGLDANTEKGTS